MDFLFRNAHWLLRIALYIPVITGVISVVHWGRWNFVPTETHPMGGFEFQAVLFLLMLFMVMTGNRGLADKQTVTDQGTL